MTSNIDDAADIDMFQITATAGKLVAEAGAEFPVTLQVLDSSGNAVGTVLN